MTTVIEEEPYAAAVVTQHLKTVCSNCFQSSEDRRYQRCSRCRTIFYCTTECQKRDWDIHKDECTCLVSVSPRIPTSMARLLARLMIRGARGEASRVKAFNGRTFDDLMDHMEQIQGDPERLEFFTCLAHVLQEFLSPVPDLLLPPVQLMKYFGRIVVNCFSITGDDQITLGEGVYLGLSALDHSCVPDAFVRFRGKRAILRSPQTGIKYSDKLTIPYTALDTLGDDRRAALKRQYYFDCRCAACRDPERDGFARSLRCFVCPSVCLVFPDSSVLTCISCATVQDVDVAEVMMANQEIEWHLEKEKAEDDLSQSLSTSVSLYSKHSSLLSNLNLPLASLAYRIVNVALSLEKRDVALAHAWKYIDAYRRYLPLGHPLLTSCLLAAASAASFEDPPSVRVHGLLEEARECCLLSHGPTDPLAVDVDRQLTLYRNRMQNSM